MNEIQDGSFILPLKKMNEIQDGSFILPSKKDEWNSKWRLYFTNQERWM